MQRLKQSLVSKDLCDYAEFLTKEPAFCEEMMKKYNLQKPSRQFIETAGMFNACNL